MIRSYTFKGRDICVLSVPRTEQVVRSLMDLANDFHHASLQCLGPGHWALHVLHGKEDYLHLSAAGVGPTMLGDTWLQIMKAVF